MMTTQKITQIFIDKILKAEVEPLKDNGEFEFSDRTITLTTEEGDKYEITLQAASASSLELLPASDWLTPKVYKGQGEEE